MMRNEIANDQNESEPLPEMETYEQAEAVAKERGDQFYLCAFMIKSWLLGRIMEATVRLSPKVRQPVGSLQSGKAWRGFLDIFGMLKDPQFHYSLEALSRFLRYDDPWPGLLSRARTALLLEWDRLGKDAQMRSLLAARNPAQAIPLLRRCAERWCDWLDATVHLELFAHYQFSQELPGDEDIETPFAAFGYPLCQSPAARATDGAQLEAWPQREMDTLLIALHPVAKDNRWTCGDLLKVVRKLVSHPEAHPCWSEADLAARRSAIALPPLPAGLGPGDGLPAGFDVAVAVCPPLPGGQPLWS